HLLASKAHMKQMPGIAAFSDELRDGLRGPFYDDKQGAFIAGISGAEERLHEPAGDPATTRIIAR
ncbi:MAG: hypothetical protein ACFNME_11260, partial [Actinomyces dentalis]